jgi:hypothetical protein
MAVRARPARLSLPRADAVADYDAALRISPKTAPSLHGRGIARSRTGDAAGGDVDIIQAKALQPDIADKFALRHPVNINGVAEERSADMYGRTGDRAAFGAAEAGPAGLRSIY